MKIYLVLFIAASSCTGHAADVFFLLDTSGSIEKADFRKELQFVQDVTDLFDVESGLIRVGVLGFRYLAI